ncbi:TIGR01841 family phasin [Variovorax sp. OV329]|uniref:TIGR01841 family phasin n=1 Tax=Variovorax sp. OV329 TaxID=1882825 RepID=UPI0008F16F95|nr:TIGR01841 family phasin [Variovorax sp. OV329]SFM28708.1 phasin family protein [Variovorax sp. OV329]
MATSSKTPAGKQPAAKKAGTAAGSGSTRAAAGSDPLENMQNMQKAFAKPLQEMGERLQNLNASGAASAIAASGRKDLEALMKANQKSYQGLQAVVQRQTEMLRDSITAWQGTVKSMPGSDAKEGIAKLDALGRAAFKQALDDIRELADMAAKSQAEAFEIVRERIATNVDDVKKLLKK